MSTVKLINKLDTVLLFVLAALILIVCFCYDASDSMSAPERWLLAVEFVAMTAYTIISERIKERVK